MQKMERDNLAFELEQAADRLESALAEAKAEIDNIRVFTEQLRETPEGA